MKGQRRLGIRKYSLSQRTIYEWNKSSSDWVNATSWKYLITELTNMGGFVCACLCARVHVGVCVGVCGVGVCAGLIKQEEIPVKSSV